MEKFIVFLDSNIYNASNYSFGNLQFSKLKKLIEQGHVTLLFNSVVEGEINRHIKDRIKKATKEFNKVVSSREFAAFRYEDGYFGKFEKLNADIMSELVQKRFHDYLESCQAIKIPVNSINVERIISDYFEGNYPFEISKPAEFKDAIIIQSLLEYKKLVTDGTLCVVTNDKGFRAALASIKEFVYPDINKFLEAITETIGDQEKQKQLSEYLTRVEMQRKIDGEIKSFVNDAIYTMDLMYDEFDIIDMQKVEFNLVLVDIVSPNKARVVIEVETDILVWYSYTDEEKSYFDKEDWKYLWKVETEKEEAHRVNFELTLRLDIEHFSDDVDTDDIEVIIEGCEDEPSTIDLDQTTFISGKVLSTNDKDYEDSEPYDVCPGCGKDIHFKNDALTGYCIRCSPDH